MRLWFAPSSEVPLYRQLSTQIVLAILSGDLKPGDRLPSTRELARRFAIHPNTISAGYRQLERDGWTEHRRGAGVLVRAYPSPRSTPEQILDRHIAAFFQAVRELDLPAAAVRARVAEWLAAPPPDHLLLIDPDEELRNILLTEIGQATAFPAVGVPIGALDDPAILTAAVPLCRPSKAALVRAALPSGIELITLPIRSANAWLAPFLPAPAGQLIAIVSQWPEFLIIARTMVVAAGLSPDALLLRNPREPRWRSGLDHAFAILCDSFTATLPNLPAKPHRVVFPLLADSAHAELSRFAPPPTR